MHEPSVFTYKLCFELLSLSLPPFPPDPLRNRFTLMTCVNLLNLIENWHTLLRKTGFLRFRCIKVGFRPCTQISFMHDAFFSPPCFSKCVWYLFWWPIWHQLWVLFFPYFHFWYHLFFSLLFCVGET